MKVNNRTNEEIKSVFYEENKKIEKPITAKEVLKMIGGTRPWLHRLTKKKIIRSHKLGGKRIFFESEVMEDIRKT